jgi:tRNA (cytidine56-2'-O)-methyltransferase
MVKDIVVLRYGHRIVRDYRVTTHVCLVARAFGASKIIIEGLYDKELEESINKINKIWGGYFNIEFTENWRQKLKEHKTAGYCIIHLTMYGEKIVKVIKSIKKQKKIVIIIGSQKVPKEIYDLSDYNISIGNQPHSEIAALAILLNKLTGDKQMYSEFKNSKLKIIPQKSNKKVLVRK